VLVHQFASRVVSPEVVVVPHPQNRSSLIQLAVAGRVQGHLEPLFDVLFGHLAECQSLSINVGCVTKPDKQIRGVYLVNGFKNGRDVVKYSITGAECELDRVLLNSFDLLFKLNKLGFSVG